MTRIEPTRAGAITAATRSVPQQAAATFRLPETASEASEAAAPPGEATAVSLGTLLAAEALDREAVHDRAARRQGQAVLAGLTALQRALLEGGDPAVALERLAGLVANLPQATDPCLAALLEAIALRARVELARVGH
jgi:hypothetical protein